MSSSADDKSEHLLDKSSAAFVLKERKKISDNIRSVAQRTTAMNPVHPDCMMLVIEYLDMGEIGLAVDFFFQATFNPQDQVIDTSLHDMIYMIHISSFIGSRTCTFKSIGKLEAVLELYL